MEDFSDDVDDYELSAEAIRQAELDDYDSDDGESVKILRYRIAWSCCY